MGLKSAVSGWFTRYIRGLVKSFRTRKVVIWITLLHMQLGMYQYKYALNKEKERSFSERRWGQGSSRDQTSLKYMFQPYHGCVCNLNTSALRHSSGATPTFFLFFYFFLTSILLAEKVSKVCSYVLYIIQLLLSYGVHNLPNTAVLRQKFFLSFAITTTNSVFSHSCFKAEE